MFTQGDESSTTGGEFAHALHGRDTVECAIVYVRELRWSVAPGHRFRKRAGCTCDKFSCDVPGAHPAASTVDGLELGAVRPAFENIPGAGIIAACTAFDAVSVPHHLGLGLMMALDAGGIHVPCLTMDPFVATLLTAPKTGSLLAGPAAVVRSGSEAWIALPPSHGVRWDTPPELNVPLPPAQRLLPYWREVVGRSQAADTAKQEQG